jgi:hypothetical protein
MYYYFGFPIAWVDTGLQIQVTEADIEEFEANYRGSDSEKKDLIELYKECKGNMSR